MKKLLETISKQQGTDNQQPTSAKRTSIRQSPTTSTTYEHVCIFCEKKSKYLKGTRNREPLVQCRDLRADHSIRKSAMEKKDSRILAIASREIVAAEACYHRTCYKGYTRAETSPTVASDGCGESLEDEYANLESEAYQMLFDYIRSDVLANEKIVRLTEITELLASYLTSLGVEEIKLSTKKHIRRNLQAEFDDVLLFENLLETTSVFIVPANLSPLQVAKYITTLLLEKQDNASQSSRSANIHQAAIDIREAIQRTENKMSWPPRPSDLAESAKNVPKELDSFLQTLLTGKKEWQDEDCHPRVQRLMKSFAQDLMFGVSRGKIKPPKQILLPYAVKTLTNNVELIQMLNRCGHGIAYSQLEEINTALCLQKMASTSEIPLPDNIQPHVSTTLAWDNIDRLEETLSGEGTSHRVNGIAVQARHFGPHLPPEPSTHIVKTKKRSVEALDTENLPLYNAGDRCGPRSRRFVEVTCQEALENARRKNLLWVLVRLHADARQKVSGWTGFNISVRNKVEVRQDSVGYLPTINAPATNMSTVHEVLVRSVKIKDTLQLKSIVVVLDQALYAKATEIVWKYPDMFKGIILRMGAFHTICTLLSILGKRFQDAGLRDICIESGVVAEGSVSGVLDGRRYNRAVRFHKLMYEALQRLAWKGFQS